MRVVARECPPETRVWLDDVEQKWVRWADDVEGKLERCKIGDDGNLVPDAAGERAETEIMTGKVRIEVPDWFRHHLEAKAG